MIPELQAFLYGAACVAGFFGLVRGLDFLDRFGRQWLREREWNQHRERVAMESTREV
ncbi:MAG TPA: hypothetical protein VN641_11130 [Urbifossiella sp.]|nr:hypothetical protein [Urbifossiella sp.]